MNLVELVSYFRDGGSFDNFCKKNSLDQNSEVIFIFSEKPFRLNEKLSFFEIEKTLGKIQYTYNDQDLYTLFDFHYFLEAIKESKNLHYSNLSDEQIAEKLLHYAIYNA